MKRLIPILFLVFLLFLGGLMEAGSPSTKNLPEKYRKWIEEEVVYIITPMEKEVFLQLTADRERDIFIEAFWKQRDPNPSTPENEFKTEHYRRIAYADNWFGRGTPGPGWRTEMGRIYILLGEPNSIDRIENTTEICPVVIWFYQGKQEFGLPNNFNVVFFKKDSIGDYELYSPVKFGPQALMPNYMGDTATDYSAAYAALFEIDPTVARISLSLIPDEARDIMTPSIASEILLTQKIPIAPIVKVKDTYAEKLLRYKDVVEVDYTTNYVESQGMAAIVLDGQGRPFVHYLIEPAKLSVEQYGSTYYTNIDIVGNLLNEKNRSVFHFDRNIPVKFDEEQAKRLKAHPFSFQDLFPAIPGRYTLNVLFKNTVSKEFTTFEVKITVPDPQEGPKLSTPVAGYRVVEASKYSGKSKPFLIQDKQISVSPRGDFTPKDQIYLSFQLLYVGDSLKESGFLRYRIVDRVKNVVLDQKKKISDYQTFPYVWEVFSPARFPAAYYNLEVSLEDASGRSLDTGRSEVMISPLTTIPRASVYALFASPEDPGYLNDLGNQYLNTQRVDQAVDFLSRAYFARPTEERFAMDYARVLFLKKEYGKIKEIGLPFLKVEGKYAFNALVGRACQNLGEYKEAMDHYKAYLSHYGTNLNVVEILNDIGECASRIGLYDDAAEAWEKSLQLKPDQPDISAALTKARGMAKMAKETKKKP